MKIACISDLHGNLPKIEEVDLLIIAGDICPNYTLKLSNAKFHAKVMQQNWLTDEFNPWLAQFKRVIGIAGNHDHGLTDLDLAKSLNWDYLYNEYSTLGYELGINIWGSPYTPTFYDWEFMADEDKLENLWENIPDNTDILITHGPPEHVLDLSLHGYHSCGSPSLLRKVMKVKPKYHLFGHIHESRGIMTNHVTFMNCTHVNKNLKPIYTPHYFDYA